MEKTIHKMRIKLFNVTSCGTLVYQDPLIGRLENPNLRLSVQLNRAEHRLELWHDGRRLSVFDLTTDVAQACRQAFAAYFSTLESLMQPARQKREAA